MLRLFILWLIIVPLMACESKPTAPVRPNILLIVADDLGYSDLGIFGSEIETPRIDSLAREGLILRNFYAAPTCSPSRAMLLTGVDSHLAGLGTMYERRTAIHEGREGYEGHLNERVVTIADLLRTAGYRTYMTGKWHLGFTPDTDPSNRGFDRSFALLDGGAFHLNDRALANPQMTGLDKARYTENGEPAQLPNDYYSTQFFTEQLIDYIDSDKLDNRPFFAYLAYSAPHFPLQAPESSRAKYRGRYDRGYDEIYSERLTRMLSRGTVHPNARPFLRTGAQVPWETLSAEHRELEARRMEIYAAMIDDIDTHVGRIIDYLKESGEYEKTFVLFMSDNGPEGRNIEQAIKVVGDWPRRCCDNSLDNIGAADSYVWPGSNWARVSSGPYRNFKGSVADGGIRVPAVVHYPAMGLAGRISDEFVTVLDLLPTFLELGDAKHPGSQYNGRKIYQPTGKSLVSFLDGSDSIVHGNNFAAAWELSGRRAVKQGEWKLLWDREPFGIDRWTLYNLREDPGEITNVAGDYPSKFDELIALWQAYQAENNVLIDK